MRELTAADAAHGVLGGGVLACGGGGWKHHGELMGSLATRLDRPRLAQVDELPDDTWVATVTAIGAPASPTWEIRPADYVRALQRLIAEVDVPIGAVLTAQNGYSTTHNGWIQSAVLGLPVLDAAGDVRAHPTGKLGGLGLQTRPGYVATQVVSGGNRDLAGHLELVVRGTVDTCDDVLRDVSVRSGGFIAAARNPVELGWVREHAAIGAVSLALDLGAAMAAAGAGTRRRGAFERVLEAVQHRLGARLVGRGPLGLERPTVTSGGWDHGAFRVGEHVVPYLNEYLAVTRDDGTRLASYPDTVVILRADTGEGLAVRDAEPGLDVALLVVDARDLPVSSSAIDPTGLAEVEELTGLELVRFLDTGLAGGQHPYGA